MSLQRSLALLALGIASATGQQPTPNPVQPPPSVPVPGVGAAPAGAPAGANAAAPGGVPLANTKIITPIEELKLSGDALAGLYRKYTGRRVIVTTAASTAEFRFVQDASKDDPLTYGEAAQLLRKAAILENFVFVPDSQTPNLDVLTLATGGARPTNIGVGVYNESSDLPDGDAVITYVMTLSYIKPAEAVSAFTQIIGQFGSFGSIAPIANASAVIITENTTLIRKLIDLKKEIDTPSSKVGTRFVKVQYADVTEIAATLTELLTAQQSAQRSAGIQRTESVPQGGAPQIPGQGGGSGEDTPIQIIPDPRTNRIFAMGRPVDLIFVEGLVREFDVETSEKNFLRRKLKFLKVGEFLTVAENALNRAFTGTGNSAGATQGGGGNNQQGGNRNQQGGNNNNNRQQTNNTGRTSTNATNSNFGGGGGTSSTGSSGSSGSSLSDPSVDTAPQSVLVGRTLLVADQITNSIVVQGPPSGLEIIERLLDQIDVKPDQVMISSVIGQLTLENNHSFGVDYLYQGSDFIGRGGSGGIVPGLPIVPGTTPFNPGSISGSGLHIYGKVAGDLSIFMEALQQRTDFTVLSRPSIFTANNQKGTISSGERIAIPTSSNSFSNGGASTNIEYQDVVLKLEVIPQINADNEISLQIALLNDEVTGTQTIAGAGSNGEDLEVPQIATREILTTVTVPNDQTIVLGGLIITRDNQNKSGIPILCDIPYIGSLFSSTKNEKDRSELMVFIQPSVVKSANSLDAVQVDMDGRYQVSPDLHTMANGAGLVPDVSSLHDKSGSSSTTTTSRTTVAPAAGTPSSTTMKPTIRPAHRR